MWRGCSRPRLTLELRPWRHVPDLFWQFIQVDLRVLPISQKAAAIAVRLGNSSTTLLNVRNRAHAHISSAKRCGACSQKTQCTSGRYKYLAIHIHESARQRARELVNTAEFSLAQRQRKKVEALFAELKNQIGLRRLRLRRIRFVREQFFLA